MNDAPDNDPTTSATKPPALVEATWEEFAAAGLFWWINRTLHLFGWALVREIDGDVVTRVYPARCRFRGFDEETEADGFRRLTAHLRDNTDDLVRQTLD